MKSPLPIDDFKPDIEPSPSVIPERTFEPNTEPTKSLPQPLPAWRLWAPLMMQLALVLTIPAQDAFTFVTGRSITLQTAPVDPYDPLRGYSQTLNYTISSSNDLKKLPGGNDVFNNQNFREGSELYVVLEEPDLGGMSIDPNGPGIPWKPVRVSPNVPTDLKENQVALRGQYNGWLVEYGLERYYMPENQRNQLNNEISRLQQKDSQAFVVDVKVDNSGNSVPVSLWISDRQYRF